MTRKRKARKPRSSAPKTPSDTRLFGPLACFRASLIEHLIRPAIMSLEPAGSISHLRTQFNERFNTNISTGVLKGWMQACGIQLERVNTLRIDSDPVTSPVVSAPSAPSPSPVPVQEPAKRSSDLLFDQDKDPSPSEAIQAKPGVFVSPGIGVVGGLLNG